MGRVTATGIEWIRCASVESIEEWKEAPGRSSLFMTRIRLGTPYLKGARVQNVQRTRKGSLPAHLSNCCQTPFVCASTPSTESIITTAPSTTRLALSTSMPKSACPGVSMRLNVQSFHLTGMLADWIVIPRSRSAGRKSVVVLPVSTDPGVDMNDDLRRMDSVSVVFPESEDHR